MEYVVITLMPEIFDINPAVFGPFETRDEAEDFLEHWIAVHPGTHGVVRRLIRPVQEPWASARLGSLAPMVLILH
jgi:hypothetical protein